MSTISEAIKEDHRELEQYYNEVVNNAGNHDLQDRFGNQFTWELARHSVGEELVVYPAFEKYMGEKGKEMAESDRKEHAAVGSNPDLPKDTTQMANRNLVYLGQAAAQGLSGNECL
jgi:hemerythrin superfamily protein